jgi:hypothetical protein
MVLGELRIMMENYYCYAVTNTKFHPRHEQQLRRPLRHTRW